MDGSNRTKITLQQQVSPGDVVVPAILIGTGLLSLGPVPYPLSDVGNVPPDEEPSPVGELTLPSRAFSLKDPCLGIISGSNFAVPTRLSTLSRDHLHRCLVRFFFSESYDSLIFAPNFRRSLGVPGCN